MIILMPSYTPTVPVLQGVEVSTQMLSLIDRIWGKVAAAIPGMH